MLPRSCRTRLDDQRAGIAQALHDSLEHSTSCPKRYNHAHPSCICHVQKAVLLVEQWEVPK